LHLRDGNLAPIVISRMAELSENADTD